MSCDGSPNWIYSIQFAVRRQRRNLAMYHRCSTYNAKYLCSMMQAFEVYFSSSLGHFHTVVNMMVEWQLGSFFGSKLRGENIIVSWSYRGVREPSSPRWAPDRCLFCHLGRGSRFFQINNPLSRCVAQNSWSSHANPTVVVQWGVLLMRASFTNPCNAL